MLYPLTFQPIFKERVWGGRELERLYRKPLPPGVPIGESWEISDRPGDVSVIANGPLAGKDLRWLMENHAAELLGEARLAGGPLPAARSRSSTRRKSSRFRCIRRPPKRRRWAASPRPRCGTSPRPRPGAELFVGLKRGVTRAEFERKIQAGTVAECFHRVPVQAGRRHVPAQRPRSRHRRGPGHLRDPAELGHHLPRVRLEPRRPGRQAARAARPAIAGQHRLQRLRAVAAPGGLRPGWRAEGAAAGARSALHRRGP